MRSACRFTVPTSDAAQSLDSVVQALVGEGFSRGEARGTAVVLTRGSAMGDTLLNATGLSLITTRIGSLSLQAVVVVAATARGRRSEVVASMVVGDELAPLIGDAVDTVIDGLVARGVDVEGPGWTRSVDLPGESLGHPETAREHGLRR
ncbi:hypothetical protein [Microbacterium sp. BH-3-3-3]|uniref:hypothetical protein n=1 Tax=Microbacterium sp. BH-3-3-3 TaxID=1906742 RepID=UPI0011A2423C|nr:hypothetical protein [Microbacterium sp. BH-3-3-3]